MQMPFRLRPQPSQPVWKVNDQVELVDDAFDKFVGQAGGKGTRGREVLPEEIKVSETNAAIYAEPLRKLYGS
jgi:large subunit ribosomal protein L15